MISGPSPDARRVEMPDGHWWRVVRRHEMARIRTRQDLTERKLYLLFFSDDGSFRRAEVAPDFPDPATLPDATIIAAWQSAQLHG